MFFRNHGNTMIKDAFVIVITIIFLSSCTSVRKYQKNKAFVYKNNINLTIDNVTPDEKVIIKSRLTTQLDDSSKVKIKDVAFIIHYIDVWSRNIEVI